MVESSVNSHCKRNHFSRANANSPKELHALWPFPRQKIGKIFPQKVQNPLQSAEECGIIISAKALPPSLADTRFCIPHAGRRSSSGREVPSFHFLPHALIFPLFTIEYLMISVERQFHIRRGIEAVITRRS